MKMNLNKSICKRTVLMAASATFALSATAMPPRRGFVEMSQPDGGSVMVEIRGSETSCDYVTPDGYLLLPDAKGNLCYARRGLSSRLECSGRVANRGDALSFADAQRYATAKDGVKAAPAIDAQTHKVGSYPTKGDRKVLVVLAQFSDLSFQTADIATKLNRMLNEKGYSDNGATGSARDYFEHNSSGQFRPEMFVAGPVTLPKEMYYYGAPTESGSADSHPAEMVRDACQLLDDQIDFSEYDADGDGRIDNVYLIYPGYSQADGANPNTIWPHSSFAWATLGAVFDNVCLDRYACSNELDIETGAIVEIGTFCHEFSHVLGLPDLYPTKGTHSAHPSTWTLMADGGRNNQGRTPPCLSSYERMALGWLNPEVLTASDTDYQLAPLSSVNAAYIVASKSDDDFFVVENRKRDGWDAHLPGEGLLVWHIDYDASLWTSNNVNNDASRQRIDLVEADSDVSSSTRGSDAFPGAADLREFGSETTTTLKFNDGSKSPIAVCNIREASDGVGSLLFNAVDAKNQLGKVAAKAASDASPVSFVANWQKLDGATYYAIEVYEKMKAGSSVVKRHAPGYRMLIVDDIESVELTGLNPETDYFYVVRGFGGGKAGSYSDEIGVRTLDKDFRFEQPRLLKPSDISDDGFTASWQAVNGAKSYVLTVEKSTLKASESLINDFEGNASNGWTIPEEATLSQWYYGASAPALSMSGDLAIESPVVDGHIVAFKMWYRGLKNGQDDVNRIEISGLCDGEWTSLKTISPISVENEGELVEISPVDVACSAVKVEFIRPYGSGTIIVDDIQVDYSATDNSPVANYNRVDVGSVGRHRVVGLDPSSRYTVSVVANDGTMDSKCSIRRVVTTLDSSMILSPSVGHTNMDIRVEGATIVAENLSDEPVKARLIDASGVTVGIHTFAPKSVSHIAVASPGVYLLSTSNRVAKVMVR